jgi:DNA polymerase I-like protein with 3'-5' exonuclease and polymerase domains
MIINKNGVDYTLTAEEEAEHLANVLQIQAKKEVNKYMSDRAKEYPPITDYIDGVVKGDQAQIQAYIDACLAVKAKYPKGVA